VVLGNSIYELLGYGTTGFSVQHTWHAGVGDQ
jgi:hypothetical protein